MMRAITQGWTFIRFLRLAIGMAILVQGYLSKDTMSMILGGAFSAMAVANVGCCGAGACAVNTRSPQRRTHDTSYEEVTASKN